MSGPHRVIKLGGSLLEYDGLVERFRAWRAAQPAMAETMIVGGGRMADAVRDASARHGLSDEDAHWLCIRIMGITAEMVSRLLPEAALVDRLEEASDTPDLRILRPERVLREAEMRDATGPPNLPHSWDVTSDSIAAWVARRLGAGELVLLKSSLPPGAPNERGRESFSANPPAACEPRRPKKTPDPWPAAPTIRTLADAGYVDRHFPIAAAGIARIRCVDLRDDRFAEVRVP